MTSRGEPTRAGSYLLHVRNVVLLDAPPLTGERGLPDRRAVSIRWMAGTILIGAAAVSGAAVLGGTLTMLPLGTQDGISAAVLAGLGVPAATGFALALFHTLLSLGCGLALLAALPLAMRRRARPPA